MMKTSTRFALTGMLALLGYGASAQTLYDNYETTRLVAYPFVQGTLTDNAANPAKNTVNNSSTVAKYERASGEQYATITIVPSDPTRKLQDVTPYVNGSKKIKLKIYSPAAGVPVQIVLQNRGKAIATPYAYPQGNYAGTFDATTTVANAWEELTFTFHAGANDATVMATDINQMVLLINLGKNDGSTYFMDDLMGPELTAGTVLDATVPYLYENFEDVRRLNYPFADGDFQPGVDNPSSTGGNTSPKVAKYIRNANADYAVIVMEPIGAKKFADVSSYLTGSSKISMKFYSPKSGVPVQLVLQDKAKTGAGYPNGNLGGTFDATTTVANAWETLTFKYNAGTSDPTVKATDINQIVMLINPGVKNGDTYYFDDIKGPAFLVVQGNKASRSALATVDGLWPNPAREQSHLEFRLVKSGSVTVALYDAQGRRVATVLNNANRAAGLNAVNLPTANLAAGLYQVRVEMAGKATSRTLCVQH